MFNKSNAKKGQILLGVISSRTGSSNSIRNSQLVHNLKLENSRVHILDFGLVFNSSYKIIKLLTLILLSFKTLLVITFNRNYDLIISTNPKWLLFFPLITNKKFILFMGDPFLGDVAKKDSLMHQFLWKKNKKLFIKVNVFSPFLFSEMSSEIDKSKLFFIERNPILKLPTMKGKGALYLGDYSSDDRNLGPLAEAIHGVDINLYLYGRGNKSHFINIKNKCSFFERVPLSEVKNIIPNHKFMIIILNKSGHQVPGKIYDFTEAPFNVLVLYEDYLDISVLPQPKHYIYCLNEPNLIKKAINELL